MPSFHTFAVFSRKAIVWKIFYDGLSKTLVEALPYGTVWVDEPNPLWSFVVFGVTNLYSLGLHGEWVGMLYDTLHVDIYRTLV